MVQIKKIYSPDEAQALWEKDQFLYAEIAHCYPCCDLPQDVKCVWCQEALDKEWECPKLKEVGYYNPAVETTGAK